MTELSPLARELVRAVRAAERPDPRARQRVRGRLFGAIAAGTTLGALPAAAAATTSAAAAATSVTIGKVALWVALGVGGGTVATVSVYAVQGGWQAAPSAAVSVDPAPTGLPVVEHGELRRQRLEDSRPEPAPSAAAAFGKAQPTPRAPSTLSRERGLLQRAQVALRDGDPASALSVLDEHARQFPGGVLSEERRAARAIALCRQGRFEAARAEAQELGEEAPLSPLLPRVRRACSLGE